MKTKSRIISIFLSVTILLGLIPAAAVSAGANEPKTDRSTGDFDYIISGDGTIDIFGYSGSESLLDITSEIDGYVVSGIYSYAFYGFTSLESVTIPDSVTYIGSKAFCECSSLTNVTIGDSVTNIGSEAFFGCSSLTGVTVPDSVTSIGESAFSGTQWLSDQPDGLIYIGKAAYKYKGDCPSEVIILEGTESISDRAFLGCTSLTGVTIPDSVTSIGKEAFSFCSSLTDITIPDSVTSIGAYAFDGTPWFNDKPDGLIYIGKIAYQYKGECPSKVVIREGTESISDRAFYGCSSLTSITIPDSVTSIGSQAFCQCTSLTSVTIPDSVTEIGYSAFYGCSSLTSITIPDSVTSIDERAFPDHDGFTIYGYPGSEAERYADKYGITFEEISHVPTEPDPTEPGISGDADGDGDVSSIDVTQIQRYCAFIDTGIDEDVMMNADVDGNGVLEIIDATYIQRWLAFMEIPYQIGEAKT